MKPRFWMPALAAAVVAVYMTTGAASATVLCNTNTTPCGSSVSNGTDLKGQLVSSSLLQAGFANVTCTGGTSELRVTNAGSGIGTAFANLTDLSFSGCGSCTTTVLRPRTSEPSGWVGTEIHYTSGMSGSVTIFSGSEIQVSCLGTACVYGGSVASGVTLEGGGPAKLIVNAKLAKVAGGFLCANPAPWSATYSVNEPNPLYVSSS